MCVNLWLTCTLFLQKKEAKKKRKAVSTLIYTRTHTHCPHHPYTQSAAKATKDDSAAVQDEDSGPEEPEGGADDEVRVDVCLSAIII